MKLKCKDDLSPSLLAAEKNKSRDEGMQKSDKYDIEKKYSKDAPQKVKSKTVVLLLGIVSVPSVSASASSCCRFAREVGNEH